MVVERVLATVVEGAEITVTFLTEDRAMNIAKEALRQALVNLEAVPAPAGTLPVC